VPHEPGVVQELPQTAAHAVLLPQHYPEPAEPVVARHVGGELVIALDQGFALVASKSTPDVWHVGEGGRCTCPAFRYRESCRHLAVAREASRPP
jgi:hypothetical protein